MSDTTKARPRPGVNGTGAVISSGVPGLDDVLSDGLLAGQLYLVEGEAGSGKTTLGLQFLLEGVRHGEQTLFVTLSETASELHSAAASHDWSLEGVEIRELMPHEDALRHSEQYTMFHPSEVELADTLQTIIEDVERIRPSRAVVDSLSELRLMAGSPLRYRRQVLALKLFFRRLNCTTLFLDDHRADDADRQMHSLAHGILALEQRHPSYGAEQRRLRVMKYRARSYRGGYHDFVIERGGLRVFPRLTPSDHGAHTTLEPMASGLAELDAMLGGGVARGTSTLLTGAAGTGKSSLASQVVAAALQRGETAAMFLFDESIETLMARSEGLGIPLARYRQSGQLIVRLIDPAELTPGEFAHLVRNAVEAHRATVIVIDSLNGYLNAMPTERNLTVQLHELLAYLGQQNVATLLVGAHQGIIGGQLQGPVDASYLADTIILLRYFEWRGELRQAMSVVKKRAGWHDRSIREMRLSSDGIRLGPPLRDLSSVFTGVPTKAQVETDGGA